MSEGLDFFYKTKQYEDVLEDFKKILKKNSLKFTIQREIILETLYNAQEHLTCEKIHRIIQGKNPSLKIGIATIYRTLSLLEESEFVTSLSLNSQSKKYELGAKEHHDHMICTECGNIIEFMDEVIEKRQTIISNKLNFKITGHTMQIFGICEKCIKDSKV